MSDLLHYISGPMTGLPEFNFPAFEEAAEALRAHGLHVLSAHEIVHPDGGITGALAWGEYLRGDLSEMLKCDALVLLQGWTASKGSRLELTIALELSMPIFFYVQRGLVPMSPRSLKV